MTDDLSAPLGQRRRQSRKSQKYEKWAALARIAAMWGLAGALGCFAVVFLGWTLFAEGPLGGEPTVVATVDLRASAGAADRKSVEALPGHPAETDPARPNRYDGPPNGDPPAGPATTTPNTVTIIDGSNGKRQDVPIPGQGADKGAGKPVTDQRYVEASKSGPIPRIAEDGTRPADAFAQPVKALADRPNAPRIAIVVTGLGISALGTNDALTKLPAPVTFGFAPYGADLDRLAARARDGGHELLLQVPMEPFDYPDNDPPDRRCQQPLLRQGGPHSRCGADRGRDRPRARPPGEDRARARLRGRHGQCPAGLDRAHRNLGQGHRRPRHPAGADQRGGDPGQVELSRRAETA